MTDPDRVPAPEDDTDRADDTLNEPANRDDERSDLQQAVEARADALARGEGGAEPDPMTRPGNYAGVSGTGGEVKNQDISAQ
jgi:hypothetical protein